MNKEHIILFDGVCNMCNSSVNFVIDRDKSKIFKFAALQSFAGEKLISMYQMPQIKEYDSVILLKRGKVYKKSSAALEILRDLNGIWPLLYVLKLIPPFVRDMLYDLIAKNRYRLFGLKDTCRIPDPGIKERFLS